MRMTLSAFIVLAIAAAASGQEPDLRSVLANAMKYASAYEQRFSLLVAEEHYVQETRRQTTSDGGNLSRANPGGGFTVGAGREERRVLRSDYLLVRLEGGGGWMPFRDVFEVDGRKVHDREDRLTDLFLKSSPTSFDRAVRIMQDSTRHNLGSVTRTINIPTLAILFLLPDIAPRFAFERDGQEVVAGKDVWRVSYSEVQRPTLIKTTRAPVKGARVEDMDLPLQGRLWIDPAAGTILKTLLTTSDLYLASHIIVTFREEPDLHLWVPAQMEESYRSDNDRRDITGVATYSKYRRFQVNTAEVVGKPPGL